MSGHLCSRRWILLAGLALAVACEPPGQWVSIGPTFMDDPPARAYNGRVVVLAVNPFNLSDVWAGAATGGVWHSTTFAQPGMTWEQLTDAAPSLAIGAIALTGCDPSRCQTVYVGTGENNIRRDTYYGAGLLKLEWNAAQNAYVWSMVGDTEQRFKHGNISRIVLDGGTMYIAVSVGKSASASSAVVRAPPPVGGYGIHRSDDGGLTWTLVGQSPLGAVPTDLELIQGRLFAGFLGAGIFVLSASGDWCPLHPGIPVPPSCGSTSPNLPDPTVAPFDFVEIEAAPSAPNVVYAVLGKCTSETWLCGVDPEFYRSNDGGVTWLRSPAVTPPGDPITTYSRYTNTLTVNPAFPNNIFYGALQLWISGDSGKNFSKSAATSGATHLDQQDFVLPNPANRMIRFLANDGGVYFTGDGGQNWDHANNGLVTGQFYSLAADPGGSGELLGGAQDNGTLYRYGSDVWEYVLGGDGGDASIEDLCRMFASVHEHRPHESQPCSHNFDLIDQGLEFTDPVLVTPPYLQHPATKDLYFATNRLYRRTSNSGRWEPISPVFATTPGVMPDLERENTVTAVGLASSDPGRIYVGMYDGSIWRTGPCGLCTLRGCWELLGGPYRQDRGLPNDPVTSLDVHPTNPDIVYVTYSGFGPEPKVWTSSDGGGSWSPLSDGLPEGQPVNVIRIDPRNPDRLWLGTDRGVYWRGAATPWLDYEPTAGMPNVPVYDLVVSVAEDRVYAATHGRGVFMLTNTATTSSFARWYRGRLWHLYLTKKSLRNLPWAVCTIDLLDRNGESSLRLPAETLRARLYRDVRAAAPEPVLVPVCRDGDCGRAVERVRVQCKGERSEALLRPPQPRRNAPSARLLVHKTSGRGAGSLKLVALAADSAGTVAPLCAVRVPFTVRDSSMSLARRAAGALRACRRVGHDSLRGIVRDISTGGEDRGTMTPLLSLREPTVFTTHLWLGVEVLPGDATGLPLQLEAYLGNGAGAVASLEVTFTTAAGGARGGTIRWIERSPLGRCDIVIPTRPGMSAVEVARAVERAVIDQQPPGTTRCEWRQNPRDLEVKGATVLTRVSRGLTVETTDPGIGLAVGPGGFPLSAVQALD